MSNCHSLIFLFKYLQSVKRWNKINSFRIFQTCGHFFSLSSICEKICKHKYKQRNKNSNEMKGLGTNKQNSLMCVVFICMQTCHVHDMKGHALKSDTKASLPRTPLPLKGFPYAAVTEMLAVDLHSPRTSACKTGRSRHCHSCSTEGPPIAGSCQQDKQSSYLGLGPCRHCLRFSCSLWGAIQDGGIPYVSVNR